MAGLCCAFYVCHILTDRAQFIFLYRSLCYSSFPSTGHSITFGLTVHSSFFSTGHSFTVHFSLPVTLLQFISLCRSLYYCSFRSTGHSITVYFSLPVTVLKFISLYRSLYYRSFRSTGHHMLVSIHLQLSFKLGFIYVYLTNCPISTQFVSVSFPFFLGFYFLGSHAIKGKWGRVCESSLTESMSQNVPTPPTPHLSVCLSLHHSTFHSI